MITKRIKIERKKEKRKEKNEQNEHNKLSKRREGKGKRERKACLFVCLSCTWLLCFLVLLQLRS